MELPIFELPLAILPGELTGLHVFEDRYRAMVNRSVDEGRPFGIVLRDDDGPRTTGCTAYVDQVVRRYDDGRLDIVARGGEPFTVLSRHEAKLYPAGRVETIEDRGGPGEDLEAASSARQHFSALVERSSGEAPDPEAIAEANAYAIAGRVELPSGTKQRLLEMRDEDERMQLLSRALEAANEALDSAQERAAQASSNGHVDGSAPG